MAPNYRQVQAGCWFLCWACLLTAAFASANINGIADMMILCICPLDALHSTRKLQRVSIESAMGFHWHRWHPVEIIHRSGDQSKLLSNEWCETSSCCMVPRSLQALQFGFIKPTWDPNHNIEIVRSVQSPLFLDPSAPYSSSTHNGRPPYRTTS